MGKYIKRFETHSQYEAFTATTEYILPNVSLCEDMSDEIHYNPWVEPIETRVVAKYNIVGRTNIGFFATSFSAIEIDGIEQPSVVTSYTFDTAGEHTVKYTLADPTKITNDSFRQCSGMTSITIPNTITSIESGAFTGCSGLTSITIPDSVTSMGQGVLSSCKNLTSVVLSSNITSIGRLFLAYCSALTSITIPSGVTSIGIYAFNECTKLSNITCNAITAPTIQSDTFQNVKTGGTLTVPSGSSGYDVWMGTGDYYLGKYNWTKVEQ